MDLFTYLLGKNGKNTHRDLFSYLLGKNAGGSGTYTTFSGTSLNISNTLQAKIKNIALEGNTSQDGTPTPDTPQPIKVVTGEQNVKINGKNLFNSLNNWTKTIINNGIPTGDEGDANILESGLNNVSFTKNKNGFSGVYSKLINLKANTTYMLSFQENFKVIGNPPNPYIYSNLSKFENGIWTRMLNIGQLSSGQTVQYNYTPTKDESVSLIIYTYYSTIYDEINVYDIQLEEGSQATEYEPYQSQNYPLSLGNIELAKIGDYKDYIYNDNGNWYLKKNIGKTTLNNNVATISTYWLSSKGVYGAAIPKSVLGISATTALRQSLCTMSKVVSSNPTIGENTYMFNANANSVYFFNSTFSTVAIANEVLTGAVVYCNLDNPIIEKITDTTLIQQLENINNARSYKDTTIIECTSASTDNETIGFSGDIKVTSVGNSLNTSLLSSNIQEEPNLDDVNEIEEIEEPIENEEVS